MNSLWHRELIHIKLYAVVLAGLLAFLIGALVHSRFGEVSQDALRGLENISPLLPSADPGMDNSARYIRHLALSTPGSAFPDYPGQPDYLPAGITWPPPRPFPGIFTFLGMAAAESHGGGKSP